MRTKTGFTLVTLCLFLGLAQAQTRLPYGAIQTAPARYSDVPEGHWAAEAVERLTSLGILTGYPDSTFRGTQPLTRYEIALVGARLIDYVNTLTGLVEDDPALVERLREAAQELGGEPLATRTERLEQGLERAASLEYVRSLEARVVALEQMLNDQMGSSFPGTMTEAGDMPLSAAEAAGSAEGGATGDATGGASGFGVSTPATQTEAQTGTGVRTGTVALSRRSAYPLYVGAMSGVDFSLDGAYFGLQAGYDGLVGPVGAGLRLAYNLSTREIRASADMAVRLTAFIDTLEFYGGLGVGGSFRPEGDAIFLEAPLGAEYFVTPRVGLFLTLAPSYSFAPVDGVGANVMAGVNLRF